MKFFGIQQFEGVVTIPGPVSIPLMDYTALVGLVEALALKLDATAYTAADVLAKLLTVDGPGSGIDADTLDGLSSASFLGVGTYTAADVLAKLLTVDGTGSLLDADFLDGLSAAAFAAAAHAHAIADVTGLTAALLAKLDASSYTPADVLAKLITVDGSGSGLDADTLDALTSADFLQVSTYQALSPTWAGTHTFSNVVVTPGINGTSTLQLQIAGTAQQYMTATQNAWGFGTTVPATSTTRNVFGVSGNGGIEIAALAGSPRWVAKRYNGTYATPTKVVNTNTLNLIRTEGYQETTGAFAAYATIDVVATEDWTSTANGHRVTIRSTAIGSTAATSSIVLEGPQILINGNLKLQAAGQGFYVKEGTNACMGVATLVAGTVTVATNKVTASSRIFLTAQSLGTVVVPTARDVTARVAGTSFTITSASAVDTSVVAWEIKEPA